MRTPYLLISIPLYGKVLPFSFLTINQFNCQQYGCMVSYFFQWFITILSYSDAQIALNLASSSLFKLASGFFWNALIIFLVTLPLLSGNIEMFQAHLIPFLPHIWRSAISPKTPISFQQGIVLENKNECHYVLTAVRVSMNLDCSYPVW